MFFLLLKAALRQRDVVFSTYQTVLLVLTLALNPLVIISTLLMIIDQKIKLCQYFLKVPTVLPTALSHQSLTLSPSSSVNELLLRRFKNIEINIVCRVIA